MNHFKVLCTPFTQVRSCQYTCILVIATFAVVFNPSERSSVVIHQLVELFAAGAPKDIFNCVPGLGA